MTVLKLKPYCADAIWGGTRLREEYGIEYGGPNLAEAWMLSCHPQGPSIIENGPYAGRTLTEYIQSEGKRVLGNLGLLFDQFLILIKYIDAREDLSIQVHPANIYAFEHERQYGKTEMWYILDAEPGAYIYLGLTREIGMEEFQRRIENNTLPEILYKQCVRRGECYLIPPGTLHAIGGGILAAEVQQNSNVTYRVYDYGRVGADGKPRSLHIAQAKEVAVLAPARLRYDFGGHLARCEYFTVDDLTGDQHRFCDDESFTSILVLDGRGVIEDSGGRLPIGKGDSIFVPACSGAYSVLGDCHCLYTRIGAAV